MKIALQFLLMKTILAVGHRTRRLVHEPHRLQLQPITPYHFLHQHGWAGFAFALRFPQIDGMPRNRTSSAASEMHRTMTEVWPAASGVCEVLEGKIESGHDVPVLVDLEQEENQPAYHES